MSDRKKLSKQITAYELTFLIENRLRVAMHNLLVKMVGPHYFAESVFPPYSVAGKQLDIVREAKSRRKNEKDYNIALGYEYPNLWYLDFSTLISMLVSFWDRYFCQLFDIPSMQGDDLIVRLKAIIPVRNAVAHHRYISNIDFADLQSVAQILDLRIKPEYINNFDQIALNTIEEIANLIADVLGEVSLKFSKGEYIDADILTNLKPLFYSFVDMRGSKEGIEEFNALVSLISKYNELPRKPGSGDKIRKFFQEVNLEDRIVYLKCLLGRVV